MKNQKEVWLPVKGYEGIYEVSNLGRVKSFLKGGRILKQGNTGRDYKTKPYKQVSLLGKSFRVHTLVSIAFLGHNPDGTNSIVVDHIDGNKINNKLSNLQLLSNRENLSKYKNKSSKYTGVHYHKTSKNYQANIWVNGKKKYLGSFSSEVEAYNAYNNELNNLVNGN